MTKKDYELIAGVLKEYGDENLESDIVRVGISRMFANALGKTNPLFNRQKFLEACGVME